MSEKEHAIAVYRYLPHRACLPVTDDPDDHRRIEIHAYMGPPRRHRFLLSSKDWPLDFPVFCWFCSRPFEGNFEEHFFCSKEKNIK